MGAGEMVFYSHKKKEWVTPETEAAGPLGLQEGRQRDTDREGAM